MIQLLQALRTIRRRFVLLRALGGAAAGLLLGALVAQLLLTGELLGWTAGRPLWVYLACAPLGYLLWLGAALCRRVSLEQTALYADRAARTGEALYSALELDRDPRGNPFSSLVLGVAETVAGRLKPRRLVRFEPTPRQRRMAGAACVLLAVVAAGWIWAPRRAHATTRHDAAERKVELDRPAIEALKRTAEELQREQDPRQQEIARKLQELVRQLEGKEIERTEALARVEELLEELRRERDAEQGRQSAYRELKAQEGSRGFARSIGEGRSKETARAVGESVERMSAGRRAAWEHALDRAARAARGAPETQEALRRAEEAMSGRRGKEVGRALEETGRRLEQSAKAVEDGTGRRRVEKIGRQMEALERVRRELGGAGREGNRRSAGNGNGNGNEQHGRGQPSQRGQGQGQAQQGQGQQSQGQQSQGQQSQGQQSQGQQGQGQQGQEQQSQGQQGQGQQGQGQQWQGQQGQGQQGQGQQSQGNPGGGRQQGQQGQQSQGNQGGGQQVRQGQRSQGHAGGGQQGEPGQRTQGQQQGQSGQRQFTSGNRGGTEDSGRGPGAGDHAVYDPGKDIKFRNVKVEGVRGPGPRVRLGTRWGLPDQQGKPLVRYRRVLQRYRKAAEKAVSTQGIPRAYRERVGRYFDDLQPRK